MVLQFITPYSIQIGVAGAGTMGSGIALAMLLAGLPVTLYDLSPDMLEKAQAYIGKNLERKNRQPELRNLLLTSKLDDLHTAGIIIEAVPENLDLKRELFNRLDKLCPPPAILATNTSTLPVTAIAAATGTPERVAGMHFFNPAPVLPLVEVVRNPRTSEDTIQNLVRLAEVLGKTAVIASDTPGFIVNRVARPFYGEALRLLGEGAASAEKIDQIVRIGGGFRMGPFQLMDLIGVDINLAAMQSMYEQSFGEPRYRPHRIQVQMVQQNSLGRKTGRGFYTYTPELPLDDPPIPRPGKTSGRVYLTSGSYGARLGEISREFGYTQESDLSERNGAVQIVILRLGTDEGLRRALTLVEDSLPGDTPVLCQCADVTLTEVLTWSRHPERLVGFDGLFFSHGPLATLVASPFNSLKIRAQIEEFVRSLGRLPAWVEDTPGLVLPRIVCMLANEAAFALTDGVADAEKIDLAMRLGVNYPKGPLSWAKEIGYAQVVKVLDHLQAEFVEERYRAAYLLRRWSRLDQIST